MAAVCSFCDVDLCDSCGHHCECHHGADHFAGWMHEGELAYDRAS